MKKFNFTFVVVIFLFFSLSVFSQGGGRTLRFDGINDYVIVPNSASLESDNGTFEFWFKLDANWSVSGNPTIFGVRDVTGARYSFHVAASRNSIGMYSPTGGYQHLNYIFHRDKWYHVAFVEYGTATRIYVNGKYLGNIGTHINTAQTGLPLIIASRGFSGEYFHGDIDEIRIWNTIRTQDQIKQNMYKPLTGDESGLVAYYNFNRSSGTTLPDLTSNNNNGVLYDGANPGNGPVWWWSGAILCGPGKLLDFDGTDDYVRVEDALSLRPGNGSMTMALWVKIPPVDQSTVLIEKVEPQPPWHQYGLWINGPDPFAILPGKRIAMAFLGLQGNHRTCYTVNDFADGSWHFIVGVADKASDILRIYVDGYEQAVVHDNSGQWPNVDNNYPVILGANLNSDGSTNMHFDGPIDEVSIWKVALTLSQIREMMHNNLVGNEQGLSAYYRFDHTANTYLTDLTPNNNHGVLHNMTTAEGLNDWERSLAPAPFITVFDGAWNSSWTWNGHFVPNSAWSNAVILTDVNVNSTKSINDISIYDFASLQINSTGTFTVNGDFNNAGIITLKADASNAASFLNTGAITGNGEYNAEFYIDEDRWHYVSSPVSNAVSNVFLDLYLKWFNEGDSSWNYIVPTDIPLYIGQGYAAWSKAGNPGTTTVTFTGGMFNTGNIILPVTATDQGSVPEIGNGEGWNFVGNPFPSAIDWDNANWIKTNIDGTVYVYNGVQYISWNGSAGGLSGGVIPALQGFIVKANDFNPVLQVPQSARLHGNDPYKNTVELNNLLVLSVEGNGYSDKTYINFNINATEEFDNDFDAYKLKGIEEAPQIYSMIPNTDLSINVLPEINENQIIPVGFEAGKYSVYTISVSGLESFDPDCDVYLEDLIDNYSVSLSQNPEYSFVASPDDNPHRFDLHFGTLDVRENSIGSIHIFSFGNTVFVNNHNKNAVINGIEIFNIRGQEIYTSNHCPDQTTINLNVDNGFYIVKVVTEDNIFSEKVYIY